MIKIGKLIKKLTWGVSLSLGFSILIFAILMLRDNPLLDDYLFIATIIALLPPTVVNLLENRWRAAIDEHLPDLFRSIVQAQQTGMTLPNALEEASKRDYGPLSIELRKIINQMSWGWSFEDAFDDFGRRADTALVRSTVPIVVEASRSGGRVEKVFAPMKSFFQTSLAMQKERKAQTRPYTAIIYIAFYVFIFTVVLLFKAFFVNIESSPIFGVSALTPEAAGRVFFHMSFIQALFGGLVAGKMGEGSVFSGLKHSAILLISGYAALRVVVW
ncbi:MAG: type II secretion system F family protein [Candidatus Bathyarchaeota archaeon]|nr:type II secretion system F family protein [Candidatus Bathyarchaeota archaeon]